MPLHPTNVLDTDSYINYVLCCHYGNFTQAIPAIYRLSVMYRTTTTLISISPSSLNTPAAKATFYVFHMMPEWISVSLLLGLNIREIFDTGMLGDWRIVDETKKEQDGTERREYKVSQTPRSTSKDLVDHTS